MPKKIKRSKTKLTDAPKLIQVDSVTYGKHLRAARGSKTSVTINEALAAQSAKTSLLNTAAKAVYDVLKVYSQGFKEGQLWQAILSRMRKANSADFKSLLQALYGLELNSNYTLNRFGNVPMFMASTDKKALKVDMQTYMPPELPKKNNCYQYALLLMLFDKGGACINCAVQTTTWLGTKETAKQSFLFEKPVKAVHYLMCLTLTGGINEVATTTLASKGMAIVRVVEGGNLLVK